MKSISIQQKSPVETSVELKGSLQTIIVLLLNAAFQNATFAAAMIAACQIYTSELIRQTKEQQQAGEVVSDTKGVVDDLPF